MAVYGVTFNALSGTLAENTLTKYGLMLVDDVVLSSPELKTNYIDVPGMDGSIDASESPQGYPVYQNRTLSFSLYKDVGDEELAALRMELMTKYHGRQTALAMPFEDGHYLSGRFQFGALDSTKRGIIPVSGTVYPYILESGTETILRNMTSDYQSLSFSNEGRAVIPSVYVETDAVIQYLGTEYELTVSDDEGGHIFLMPELTIPGSDDGTLQVTATWQFKLKTASEDPYRLMVRYQRGHL